MRCNSILSKTRWLASPILGNKGSRTSRELTSCVHRRSPDVRAKRNPETWQAAIRAVEDTARTGENLMPRILAAVDAHATVGEISDAMRKVYGEYREAVVI